MLNADLVGFHVFEYARHFLTWYAAQGSNPDTTHSMPRRARTQTPHTACHAGLEPQLSRQGPRKVGSATHPSEPHLGKLQAAAGARLCNAPCNAPRNAPRNAPCDAPCDALCNTVQCTTCSFVGLTTKVPGPASPRAGGIRPTRTAATGLSKGTCERMRQQVHGMRHGMRHVMRHVMHCVMHHVMHHVMHCVMHCVMHHVMHHAMQNVMQHVMHCATRAPPIARYSQYSRYSKHSNALS